MKSPVSLAEDRRTFWPRAGPVGIVPDLGDDRPCGNCGYNLRGLAFDSACPECGAVWGIDQFADPIPFNEERNAATFLQTLLMVLTAPRDLAQQVWTRDMLWLRSARRFRGICVALGTIGVASAVISVTAMLIGFEAALWCIPIDVMAVCWWFIALTGQPARFFADKGSQPPCRRAGVLSSYLAAPLALSPLHLGLIALTLNYDLFDEPLVAIIMHGSLILVQMLLMASAEGALLWQLVEVPRSVAFTLAAGNAFLRSLHGAIYVWLIPAMAALLAKSVGGG
jgi:hypothetical protein